MENEKESFTRKLLVVRIRFQFLRQTTVNFLYSFIFDCENIKKRHINAVETPLFLLVIFFISTKEKTMTQSLMDITKYRQFRNLTS